MTAAHVGHGSHRALLYEDRAGFVEGVGAFVREGLETGARVLVAAAPKRLAWLREALGDDVDAIDVVGADAFYARHGPMFRSLLEYLERHGTPGRGQARIVAEQALAGRSAADVRAYMRYEAATNLAVGRFDASVLCPYDARRLPDAILDDVQCTHPELVEDHRTRRSDRFTDPRAFVRRSAAEPAAPRGVEPYELHRLEDVPRARAVVRAMALAAGLPRDAVEELELAVGEVAANAVLHGRPPRRLSSYVQDGALVCQVRDAGCGPPDPLAGFLPPDPERLRGRGLWLAHQLCDIVEIASDAHGTDVVLQVRLPTLN